MPISHLVAARAALAVVFGFALGLGACAADDPLASWLGEPWSFVESVGGIRVGAATRLPDGRISIEFACNVAGEETITRRPTEQNAGLGVRRIRSAVRRREIAIGLTVAVGANPRCPPLVLDGLEPGSYQVKYRGLDLVDHPLGAVEIPIAAVSGR